MIFSNLNLIDPSAAIHQVRQSVTQAFPTALSTTDNEQVRQALDLAAADLDTADPLLLPVTIDTATYTGQDSPTIPNVGNQFIGTQLEALYMPAAIAPENLIPWAAGDTPSKIIPQAVINANLLALVRWPRRFTTAVVSPYNGTLFTADNIALANIVVLSGSGSGPSMDGLVPDNYGFCLLTAQTNPAQNGIYQFYTNGAVYSLTRPTLGVTSAWDWAHQGSTFYIRQGSTKAGAYYQLTTPNPIVVDTTSLAFTTLSAYISNIDATEFAIYIVPRAAGYLVQSLAATEKDKNLAAMLMTWAATMFARPLPASTQATSHRIQSVTRYANT